MLEALAADPAQRYASAAELRQALRRYRRRPLIRAAASGLTLLAALALQAWVWPLPWSHRPVPAAGTTTTAPPPTPVPVRVERMELHHLRGDGATSLLGTIGKDDTSDCIADDDVRIRARLTATAYCYLIALHPDGSTQLYYPGSEATPPPLSDRLSYPLGSDLSPLTDGVGLQAFVLIASRRPLPAYSAWKAQLGNLSWAGTQAEGVRHYDGDQFERLPKRRSSPRPSADAPTAFASACRALARVPGVDAIDAWAFPVLPKAGP